VIPHNDRVLRPRQAAAKLGLGKSRLYELVKDGVLPRPIRITGERAVGFLESELNAFLASRKRVG